MITFKYFKDCPHAGDTLRNLMDLARENLISEEEIEVVEVPDAAAARECGFQGSPTILINGVDIYTLRKPEGFKYACRVYEFRGKKTGIIPRDFMETRIKELRG